jgi:hypothetical protein
LFKKKKKKKKNKDFLEADEETDAERADTITTATGVILNHREARRRTRREERNHE